MSIYQASYLLLALGSVMVTMISLFKYANSERSLANVFVFSLLNASVLPLIIFALWVEAGIDELFEGRQYGLVPNVLFMVFVSLSSGAVVLQETWRRRHSLEMSDPDKWISPKERVSKTKNLHKHENNT